MAQVINGIPLNSAEGFDKITSTDKVTAGYFSDGTGKLQATNLHSASISTTNDAYYYGIAQSSVSGAVQFNVAYGHTSGKGSQTNSGDVKGNSEAIYKQWANILLAENEVTGGFKISAYGSSGYHASAGRNLSNGTWTAGSRDEDIFVLVGKRSLFKDRLNKKNWTIHMSGSRSNAGAGGLLSGSTLTLTDDSATVAATSTPAGPRYNIVSGSNGSVTVPASTRTFGWFYPDQGVLVFSATELSGAIPGSGSQTETACAYDHDGVPAANRKLFRGFGTTDNVDKDYNNALRFINCVKSDGGYLQFRSEEDQTSVSYFCRAKAAQLNFSNNPTFVSGSDNELRHKTMKGNPSVFITGVELYNSSGHCVAVGKLSTPLKKNFSSEATIKVKLTF